MEIKLVDWLWEAVELLQTKKVKRLDQTVLEGKVKAYWVGTTIRIDFDPWDDSRIDKD